MCSWHSLRRSEDRGFRLQLVRPDVDKRPCSRAQQMVPALGKKRGEPVISAFQALISPCRWSDSHPVLTVVRFSGGLILDYRAEAADRAPYSGTGSPYRSWFLPAQHRSPVSSGQSPQPSGISSVTYKKEGLASHLAHRNNFSSKHIHPPALSTATSTLAYHCPEAVHVWYPVN